MAASRSSVPGILLFVALIPPVLFCATVLAIAMRGGDVGPNGELIQILAGLIVLAVPTMAVVLAVAAIWARFTRD